MKLNIAGGTYWERCLFPQWNELFGSGLRAVYAVRSLRTEVDFHTFIADNYEQILRSKSAGNFGLICQATSPTIVFDYYHGFSRPHITPPVSSRVTAQDTTLTVNAEHILRFGFLEGQAVVHGKRVVYDPQNPWKPEPFAQNGSTAESLALVVNRSEARLLGGTGRNEEVAEALHARHGAEVVVIKNGTRGSFVSDGTDATWVSPYRSNFVWPIGSGDIFSAVFANYWASHQMSAVDAADLASKATALYCDSRNAALPATFPEKFPFPRIIVDESRQKRVYLAGPFFNMPQRWMIEEAKVSLEKEGFSVFSPFHEVGFGDADEVYQPDIEGVKNCDLVFACLDGLDPGTIYEIGYAHHCGKPVVVFVQNEGPEDLKMLVGGGCMVEHDFVTAIYKAFWQAYA